jgi:hypothetical protein
MWTPPRKTKEKREEDNTPLVCERYGGAEHENGDGLLSCASLDACCCLCPIFSYNGGN